MKKLALFLLVLISLSVIVGCNNRKSVVRFTPEGEVVNEESEPVSEEAKKPDTVVEVKTDTTKPVTPTPAIELKTETESSTAFEVTSLQKNIAETTKGYHLIEGTTPEATAKILVNDFPLSKYRAGETKWSYIVAVSLGNLKRGDNKFTVKAVDADDKELGSKTFTITYKGVETASLASTGPVSNLALAGLITLIAMGALSLRRRSA